MSTTEIRCLETSTHLLGAILHLDDVIGTFAGRQVALMSNSTIFTLLSVATRVAVTAALIFLEFGLISLYSPLITSALVLGMYFYPVPGQLPLPIRPPLPPVGAAPPPVITGSLPNTIYPPIEATPSEPAETPVPMSPPPTPQNSSRLGISPDSAPSRPEKLPRNLFESTPEERTNDTLSDFPPLPPPSAEISPDTALSLSSSSSSDTISVERREGPETTKVFLTEIFTKALGKDLSDFFVNKMLPPNITSAEYDSENNSFSFVLSSPMETTITEAGPNAILGVLNARLSVQTTVRGTLDADNRQLTFEWGSLQLFTKKMWKVWTITLTGLRINADQTITLAGAIGYVSNDITGTSIEFRDSFDHIQWNT